MFRVEKFLKDKRPTRKTGRKSRPAQKRWSRKKILVVFGSVLGSGVLAGVVAVIFVFAYFGQGLPDIFQLENYEPPVVTRIHADNGSLMTEYAREKRLFVPINAVPPQLIEAYLAAEDGSFYDHFGVDMVGIFRSAAINVGNVFAGKRPVGGSTITQQVAKNFLIGNETSLERKIREAILAIRMERVFTKNQILELYMNDVYLGFGSYGVAAAAQNYFNKSLDELTLPEMAYLAALLKAPSNYHPIRNAAAATSRRNWVLGRMRDEGFISRDEYLEARAAPLEVLIKVKNELFRADYFEEEVRRELLAIYGENNLYAGGLSVSTTLDPTLQAIAEQVLREGLVNYDRRHGWKGALTTLPMEEDWAGALGALDIPLGISTWRLAVVTGFEGDGAVIGFEDRSAGFISLEAVKWARRWAEGERRGRRVDEISQVINIGDVIAVELIKPDEKEFSEELQAQAEFGITPVFNYDLRQIPEIEGALVAMDPHTGRVLAMVGGFDYKGSQFNRATQAKRQTGSAFKPIVYGAALDAGFTPSSLVLDAPFVIDQGEGQAKWKPSNSSNKFYGPSTLRLGLEKSRNLMTVRLAQYLKPQTIVNYAKKLGLGETMQPTLAAALGANETTLLKMTAAYGMIVNGGFEIKPTLINRIQNRRGETIFRHDERICQGCDAEGWEALPFVPDNRKRVMDARTSYQLVSMLEGVVQNGTGRKIRVLGMPLGGKTGTTNDWKDGWFIGFSPDLVVGVYVGFDQPRSMGTNEEGSTVAVPIFRDFMAEALERRNAVPFRVPPGIRLVRINADTGLLAKPGDKNVILEAFI
ncbi:MAG: penicillin-binding protein 1A, partial [Sphingomonadales bacterium]